MIRADEYSSWISVGWALHNIGHGLLDQWTEFHLCTLGCIHVMCVKSGELIHNISDYLQPDATKGNALKIDAMQQD